MTSILPINLYATQNQTFFEIDEAIVHWLINLSGLLSYETWSQDLL